MTRKKILYLYFFLIVCILQFQPFMLKGYAMDEKNTPPQKNRLALEKSPYLLQHADNPVNWYAWGPDAFDKALKDDLPIFLSIGYSTCHWCHVMAHESFEDPEVAKLLNNTFVCIKVDREERPDIDSIYMAACQMMTEGGGWPLTIIMTPEKKPFFAATYIPKKSVFGRMGMLELIPEIDQLWKTKRPELLQSANNIVDTLNKSGHDSSGPFPDKTLLDKAFKNLAVRFDRVNGGFTRQPKFPTPHNILFLLRYWKRTGDKNSLEMAEKTLERMRMGGIYDHLGYGFHRYSTDAQWLVPHFEKMLYDQALLAVAYTEAWQATGRQDFKQTVDEIFQYIQRDMTNPDGGFFCAEDADSEGVEGKFYLWKTEEIRNILTRDEAQIIVKFFNIKERGNFEDDLPILKTGDNILHTTKTEIKLASELNMPETVLLEKISSIKNKLFNYRRQRIPPHKDNKILTDWNGLMLAALAKAGRVFNRPDFTASATNSAVFILKNLRRTDGRLMHRFCEGQSTVLSHLDDYSFLVWGLIELYETTFDTQWLKKALMLNDDMINHFWDNEDGGFYSTADDAEGLILRQKEIYDGAIPSGNSVAVLNLLRLSRLTGNQSFEEKAYKTCCFFSKQIKSSPLGCTQLLCALDFSFGPTCEIVIAGMPGQNDTKEMLNTIRTSFIPSKVVIFRPDNVPVPEITELVPFTQFQRCINNKATAYVCRNFQCSTPTSDIKKMLNLINGQ